MGKIAEKIKDLTYDEITTISVIESDDDLAQIVKDELKLSFNLLRKMVLEGQLSSEKQEFLRSIFDKIILTKNNLIDKYLRLSNTIGKVITMEIPEVKDEEVKEKQIEEAKVITLPRRYGKEKILQDIAKQDGKATPLQRAMLELNVLKNITVNLNARCIKDLLTDNDCRDIISVVKIAKQKLKTILEKK